MNGFKIFQDLSRPTLNISSQPCGADSLVSFYWPKWWNPPSSLYLWNERRLPNFNVVNALVELEKRSLEFGIIMYPKFGTNWYSLHFVFNHFGPASWIFEPHITVEINQFDGWDCTFPLVIPLSQGDSTRITGDWPNCQAAPFGYDGAASKTFYVGKMQVGNMEHPQELQVGSGWAILISIHFPLFIFCYLGPWAHPSTTSPFKGGLRDSLGLHGLGFDPLSVACMHEASTVHAHQNLGTVESCRRWGCNREGGRCSQPWIHDELGAIIVTRVAGGPWYKTSLLGTSQGCFVEWQFFSFFLKEEWKTSAWPTSWTYSNRHHAVIQKQVLGVAPCKDMNGMLPLLFFGNWKGLLAHSFPCSASSSSFRRRC